MHGFTLTGLHRLKTHKSHYIFNNYKLNDHYYIINQQARQHYV